jgi:hypothetical protein
MAQVIKCLPHKHKALSSILVLPKKKNPKRNKQKLQTGLSSTRVQYTSQKYVNLTTLYLKGNKQTTFKTRKTNARQLRNINNQNY